MIDEEILNKNYKPSKLKPEDFISFRLNEIEEQINSEMENGYASHEFIEVMSYLKEDNEFMAGIDIIIQSHQDLIFIQSNLILFLQKYLKNFEFREQSKQKLEKLSKMKEKELASLVQEITRSFMISQSESIKKTIKETGVYDKKLEYLNKNSRQDFIRCMQRWSCYEVHKFLSPRQIAGERSKENFVNNIIKKGLKYALTQDSGKKNDLARYNSKELNSMIKFGEKAHKIFKKGGQGILR